MQVYKFCHKTRLNPVERYHPVVELGVNEVKYTDKLIHLFSNIC